MLLIIYTTILALITTFVSSTAIASVNTDLKQRDVGTEIESQITSLYNAVIPYDADISAYTFIELSSSAAR